MRLTLRGMATTFSSDVGAVFCEKATTVVSIGTEHLKGRHHATLEAHQSAYVGRSEVPTDGKVFALPTIWRLRLAICSLWHSFVHETLTVMFSVVAINRPTISAPIAGWYWLAPAPP